MKEVRISLSEERLAEVEAEVATGEASSISELIEWALDLYLSAPDTPSPEEMYRMALEAEAEADATAAVAREVMEAAVRISVPLRVETGFGRSWGEAH